MDPYKSSVPTAKRATGKCKICDKPILVASTRGSKSIGYCSRICASMSRYQKRFKGARSEQFSKPIDLGKYTHG